MLKHLTVKNYALIADISVTLTPGLNIFTGETGAGKSILLGAIGTILGERVDTTVLRTGADKAVIEGVFEPDQGHVVFAYLCEKDLDADDGQILIRREITDSGRTRAFVNDTPVQLSILQEIGDFLVDLHGQHEHQSLLRETSHLDFVDSFGALEQDRQEVHETYRILRAHLDEMAQLTKTRAALSQEQDYYAFQIEEIDKVAPGKDEDVELEREELRILHGERLFNLAGQCYTALYETENSIYDEVSKVQKWLAQLSEIDADFKEYTSNFESVRVLTEDLAATLETYRSKIEFSPQRLDEIQARIAQLNGLKKKYGPTLDEVLTLRTKLAGKADSIYSLQAEHKHLEERIEQARKAFSKACTDLSEKRHAAAGRIEKLIPEVLEYLGMHGSRFKVALQYQDDPKGLAEKDGQFLRASADGIDFAKFMISTNVGEELKPLSKVASGGEISRVMLALKSTLARDGQVPVLIFDEIDSGISGRVANAVGRKLLELSGVHQVLCITHLPQIACMGDTHYSVEKVAGAGRIETQVRRLSLDERAEAIAKLLAGEEITETHLQSAKELLQGAVAA